MGLSKCELPFNSNKLKRLLKIESNSFNRFSLTVYDDQAWYDEILLKEWYNIIAKLKKSLSVIKNI